MIKDEFKITGMTCNSCVTGVTDKLMKIDGVTKVRVDLKSGEAEISMRKHIPLAVFESSLHDKYDISRIGERTSDVEIEQKRDPTKLQQLKPLFLIFGFLFGAVLLLHYKDWNMEQAMLDFMGLFFVVFSFFKFLDLKGFPESFKMYDPLAKILPVYGRVYPFLELTLGLLFLLRLQLTIALVATIVVLGITIYGVAKALLDKKSIRCACMGTALKLPMTEATFIENSIMLLMSFWMLSRSFLS